MKITLKLFISFLIIAALVSFVSIFFSIKSISSRYESSANTEIRDLSQQTENVFYEYLSELSRKALFLSELREITDNLDNPDEILTMIELKAFFLTSVNVRIINEKNKIVVYKNFSSECNLPKDDLFKISFFSNIKDTFLRKSGLVEINGNISMLSISPIIDSDSFESIGRLILEIPIDSEFADQIREKVKSEIILSSNRKKIGTTFLDSNGERFFPKTKLVFNNKDQRVRIENKTYLSNFISIKDNLGEKVGYIEVFLNIDDLLQAKRLDIRSLIWVSFIVFVVIIIISFIIGRKLSAPILNLSKGAESISKGDLDIRIKAVSHDEIGTLTVTFNKMAESLKSQRENLEHIRLYLKNIIDSMPSILIGVDTNGRVTQWNAEAERKTSVASDNAIGKSLKDLFPQFENDLELIKRSIKDKKPQKIEKVLAKIQDDIQYTDIMIYPLVANGVEGAVIRMDDVTSRVRIENMMMQTEKMMSVGGLAAGMAHEINNPLGGILLGVQNILRRLSDDFESNVKKAEECGIDFEKLKLYMEKQKIISFLEIIHKSGERASNIVSNMLNFSRRSESKKSPVDLDTVINTTIELARNDYDLKKKYDFRHMDISLEYDDPIPKVMCVENEIQQVILNLLKNSVQAIFSMKNSVKDPKIVISLKKEDKMAVIRIKDNGPGMDEATLKRIFEPFFTTKVVGEGTGLGLSVSYFIISTNHKGVIYAESALGKGTTFVVKLPYTE